MTQRIRLVTDLFGRHYIGNTKDVVIPAGSHFDLEYDLDYALWFMVIDGE